MRTLYDLTVNYSSGRTPDHADEYEYDGPGHIIVNLCFSSDGYLFFTQEQPVLVDRKSVV